MCTTWSRSSFGTSAAEQATRFLLARSGIKRGSLPSHRRLRSGFIVSASWDSSKMELKEEFCQDASQAQDANHETSSRCDKSWHGSRFIRDFWDFVIFFYQLIVRYVLQTDVNKVNIQVVLVVYWKWRSSRLVQIPTTNIPRPRRICC